MSTAHSKIGASSMHRWEACPGSVRQSEGMVNVESDAAREGTIGHEVAAKMLLGQKYDDVAGHDEEMIEGARVYFDAVAEVKKQLANPADDKFLVEHGFDLSVLHPGLFGTADCIVYDSVRKRLYVFDYKYGKGIPVDVFEDGKPNLQLLYYGLGALETLGLPCDLVTLVIAQPRCFHRDGPVRKHTFSAVAMLDFSADLIAAAKKTEDPQAPLVPGDHCKFCPAKPLCPKLHETAVALAKEEFSTTVSYDPEKLSRTLSLLEAIESWAKGVREFAYAEANHGRVIPGYKLVAKRASRYWRDEEAARKYLITKTNLNYELVMTEPEVKSPAQIEKILKKDYHEAMKELVVSISSGSSLVSDSDPRPMLKLDAKSEFEEADLFS